MSHFIIVGIDTVTGANCAGSLADRYRILGLSAGQPLSIMGCETACYDRQEPNSAENCLTAHPPQCVLYCSSASQSVWNNDLGGAIDQSIIDDASRWAAAARKAGVPFVAIMSDAIFTGPWIFHEEESDSHCKSDEAQSLQRMEDAIRSENPDTLIVRTHAIGWSPTGTTVGWLEQIFAALESRSPIDLDCIRHATPILATDLAEIIDRAIQSGLTGTYHIGGAERVNPFQFAERLADEFDFPPPQRVESRLLSERPTGFGTGETSLQTLKIRRALGGGMPLLSDGLRRLHQQHLTGFADRFRAGTAAAPARNSEFAL